MMLGASFLFSAILSHESAIQKYTKFRTEGMMTITKTSSACGADCQGSNMNTPILDK